MILGIGTDMVDIQRIAETLDRHGDRFVARCFSAAERSHIEKTPFSRTAGYAKRWAAKEAVAKALGLGIRSGIFLKDISIINDQWGRPSVEVSGGAAARLTALVPKGMRPVLHVSLADEPPMALAFVVISAADEKK